VVVGWCARAGVCGSGSEEDGLGGVDVVAGGETVEGDGLGERAHGPGARALEVARVLHQRVGGDVVLSLHPGVRARPRREEPRQ